MSRGDTKAEALSEEVFRRKAAGETNREIGAHFGLRKAQVKGLVNRQNRKQRLMPTAMFRSRKAGRAKVRLAKNKSEITN